MTVAEATAYIRQFAANAGVDSGTYSTSDFHRALFLLGNDFIYRTGCIDSTSTVSIAEDDTQVDFSTIEDFRADRIKRAWQQLRVETGTATSGTTTSITDTAKSGTDRWSTNHWVGSTIEVETSSGVWERRTVTSNTQTPAYASWSSALSVAAALGMAYRINPRSSPVSIIDYNEIFDARAEGDTSGEPEDMGFTSSTSAEIWPTADDDYTLNVLWTPPLTSFTVGGAGGETLNIPDDLLAQALRTGGVAFLQFSDADKKFGQPMLSAYREWVTFVKGRGGRTTKAAYARKAD